MEKTDNETYCDDDHIALHVRFEWYLWQVTSQCTTSQTPPVQNSQTIKITRSGSQHPSKGPAEHFTGSVQVQPLFPALNPSRTSGGKVTFEPGARSAWHTHAFGQILIVTEGTGWIQQWGGPIEEIRKGDVVWIPAGVKHWHGATPKYSDDPHRNTGRTQWQSRGVDGEGQRRAIPEVITARFD